MNGPDFITARDVAARIGYARDKTFLNNRERLERDHAFPLPMPTSRQPLLWRASQVDAWVARQGHQLPDAPLVPMNMDMLDKAGMN